MCWAELLMSYKCEIIYRPGKENLVADYLLRGLALIDVSPVLEIKEVARKTSIWMPMEKRPGVLQRAHCTSTSHLWEAKILQVFAQANQLKVIYKDTK